MVKLSVLLLFNAMLVGLNALLMVGGLATVRVAVLLAAPVPPLVELTAPVVLETIPVCVPVTFTAMVHRVPGVGSPHVHTRRARCTLVYASAGKADEVGSGSRRYRAAAGVAHVGRIGYDQGPGRRGQRIAERDASQDG